jgi:hypothetical protein
MGRFAVGLPRVCRSRGLSRSKLMIGCFGLSIGPVLAGDERAVCPSSLACEAASGDGVGDVVGVWEERVSHPVRFDATHWETVVVTEMIDHPTKDQ